MQIFSFLFLSTGCGALNTARPLEQNQHRAGATFGGALLTQLGPPIPVPNLVIEGQSGLAPLANRPFDINYGLNLTALAFGTLGMHLGASQLLLSAEGLRPSLSITERVHAYSNFMDSSKTLESRALFLLNQADLTAAWDIGRQLGYLGLSNSIDWVDPELTLSPFIGVELRSKGAYFTQVEARYLAANRQPDVVDVSFLGGKRGALSTTISMGWSFGQPAKGVQQ
jgi:hypothetical protein